MLIVTVYWVTEQDTWVAPGKVVIVSQIEGDSTVISVPTENFEEALDGFILKTQVLTRAGRLVKETDWTEHRRNMNYKFVTYRELPVGSYNARVVVGYQLNPLSWREHAYPLAIIYVYRRPDEDN